MQIREIMIEFFELYKSFYINSAAWFSLVGVVLLAVIFCLKFAIIAFKHIAHRVKSKHDNL